MKPPVPYSILWMLLFIAQLPMLAIYLLQLLRDPIYGWWPPIVLLAVGLLVWLRWDRKSELPRRPLAVFGLVMGLAAGFAAAVSGSGWLAGFGIFCTSGAWLSAHHQHNGSRLLPIWYLTWSLLQIPLGGNAQLTQAFGTSLEHSIKSILRLVQVPHADFSGAIEVLGARYYFDQTVYSMLSWPLFVAAAMLHSALWRRTWFETLLNVLSAMLWSFVFHCGLLLSCIRFSMPADSWAVWGLVGVWGVISFGLFLSTERGFRLLLQPISESSLDSRLANPFVLAWNWCFSSRSHRSGRRRLGEHWLRDSSAWALVGGIVITLLLQLILVPRAWAALSDSGKSAVDRDELQAFVFQKSEEFEHRHTYHSPPLVRNREVDIWNVYAPLSTTEHILVTQPQPVFELQSLIQSSGWQLEKQEQVPTTLPSGQLLTYGSMAFYNGRQHAQLYYAWLSSDGSPLQPAQETRSGYLLMSKAELVKVYSAATTGTLLAEFSRFVVGVQTQLHKSSGTQ